ncbi:MAG: teichoic acid transporter [Eggerthellaceae bacterium]|nr:teichoic acid transporter [Eggerthellaceae bacterium]
MQDLHSFVDRIHYDGQREYTNRRGNIAYLDGTPLTRPASMPRTQRVIAIVIIGVAILIGLVMVNNFIIAPMRDAAKTEQTIADNLARESSIKTIPDMASLVGLDNESIKATFADAGYQIYDASSANESNEMVLYKIPGDMSIGDATVLYQQGIGALNAEQASRLLNGSWYFAVDRINGTSMVVRYADFSTGDPQVAVQNAIEKEGLSTATMTESGVDDSGNTYSMGTIDVSGTPCTWKVSALSLGDMYSISGLPTNACYVGVRLTVQ